MTEPGTFTFTGEGDQSCHTCLMLARGCVDHVCEGLYLPISGTLEITQVDPTLSHVFEFTLRDVVLGRAERPGSGEEATLIEGGELWCIDEYSLSVEAVPLTCGDGGLDAGEACDDGNEEDGDGCDSMCLLDGCDDPSEPVLCDSPIAGLGCWPVGTDCESITRCGGAIEACLTGLTSHCSADGAFVCCGGDYPTPCDVPTGGASCWGPDRDCSTLLECGAGDWRACMPGEFSQCSAAETFHCCDSDYPTFCEYPGGGGCWSEGRDCSTVTECGEDDWKACQAGETPHCSAAETFHCCGGDWPDYCEVGAYTGCVGAGADCSTIMDCGGDIRLCSLGSTGHCSTAGDFYCCNAAYPLFCDTPAYAGCWTSSTDCSTITECGGSWWSCNVGDSPNCAPDGTFTCS